VEEEALSIHRLMETSSPPYSLIKENTQRVIKKIVNYRVVSGIPVCFTLDAGPNIHLFYSGNIKNNVVKFINENLKEYCSEGKWIDDFIGKGSSLL
jgi:diphosphomevalonate decarboxylase